MNTTKLSEARKQLDEAIQALDDTHRTWSECVTSLHMAELNLRSAQKKMRACYNSVLEALNGG